MVGATQSPHGRAPKSYVGEALENFRGVASGEHPQGSVEGASAVSRLDLLHAKGPVQKWLRSVFRSNRGRGKNTQDSCPAFPVSGRLRKKKNKKVKNN